MTLDDLIPPADSHDTLIVSGDDVRRLLSVSEAMDALELSFRAEADGGATSAPRLRMRTEGAMMHVLPGAFAAARVMGLKAYVGTGAGVHFAVLLFDDRDGRLLALVEADRLGQIRTGAASGIATRHLARGDAAVGAILGTGWQARSQAEAIAAARPLREIRAWSRTAEHLERFAREMTDRLGIPVAACPDARSAVSGADVICTATTAREPVLEGAWLAPGAHVNAMGSNAENRRELDADAVLRAGVVVTDHLEQARLECGDLIPLAREGRFSWERVGTLADLVAGRIPGRTDERQVTLFESHGVATEDLAVAALVYRKARAAGMGTPLALGESHRQG